MSDGQYLSGDHETVQAAINICYDLGDADDRPSFTVGSADVTKRLLNKVFQDACRRWDVEWNDTAAAQRRLGDIVWPVADPQYRERLRLGTVTVEPMTYETSWKYLPHAPPVNA